jgi:hypothetical protein
MSDLVYLEMSYMLEAEEIIDTGIGGNLSFSCSLRSLSVQCPARWQGGLTRKNSRGALQTGEICVFMSEG